MDENEMKNGTYLDFMGFKWVFTWTLNIKNWKNGGFSMGCQWDQPVVSQSKIGKHRRFNGMFIRFHYQL